MDVDYDYEQKLPKHTRTFVFHVLDDHIFGHVRPWVLSFVWQKAKSRWDHQTNQHDDCIHQTHFKSEIHRVELKFAENTVGVNSSMVERFDVCNVYQRKLNQHNWKKNNNWNCVKNF